jgi:hypothetical protein
MGFLCRHSPRNRSCIRNEGFCNTKVCLTNNFCISTLIILCLLVGYWCGCPLSSLDSVLPQTLELALLICLIILGNTLCTATDFMKEFGSSKAEEKNRICTSEIALHKHSALWMLSVYVYHLFNLLYHLTDFRNIYVVFVHSNRVLFTSLQHVAKAWWTYKLIRWEQYWYPLMQSHKIMCGDRFLKNMQLFLR